MFGPHYSAAHRGCAGSHGVIAYNWMFRRTRMIANASAGARFRAALSEETPLQVMGAITAYAGLMAKRVGYKALYLSGGGVAANSLGMPDLGISTMEDVLTDARRIVDATGMPLMVDIDTGWGGAFNIARTIRSFINVGVAANSLGMPDLGISTMEDVLTDARRIVDATGMPLMVDIDTGWGGAFNIARTIRSFINVGVAAVHIEDQVGQKRCGHRPGKEVVSKGEMVDRVKAAVDARTEAGFVIMARTDAAAVEGIDAAIEIGRAHV